MGLVVLLFVLVFLRAFLHCSGDYENTFCVTQNDHEVNQSCEFNRTASFSQLCNSARSGEMYLLYGIRYSLNETCKFKSLNNLAIRAYNDSRAVIECSIIQDSGFVFLNVSSLEILGVELVGCGAFWSTPRRQFYGLLPRDILAALLFINGSDLILRNVTIRDSKSVGLFISDVTRRVLVESSSIINASSSKPDITSGNVIAYHQSEATNLTLLHSEFTNSGYSFKGEKCKNFSLQSSGLAIFAGSSHLTVGLSHMTFSNNTGCHGGNLAILFYDYRKNLSDSMIKITDSVFTNGHSSIGGGVYVIFNNPRIKNGAGHSTRSNASKVMSIANSHFEGNVAEINGGGLNIQWKLSLTNHLLHMEGILDIDVIDTSFVNNSLGSSGRGGLALHYEAYVDTGSRAHAHQKFRVNLKLSSCMFAYHDPHLAIEQYHLTESSVILIKSVPYLGINGITVTSNRCTGILAIGSTMVFSGDSMISNNTAITGGGIRLCSSSILYLKQDTELTITNNSANLTGGGILVNPNCLTYIPMCFFQFTKSIIDNRTLLDTVKLNVSNNSAQFGGSNLFGGSIDFCYLLYIKFTDTQYQKRLLIPPNSIANPSSISSNPQQICFRKKPGMCSKVMNVSCYPGQTVTLSIQVVGQYNGSVPGTVSATTLKGLAIGESERLKPVDITGQDITYTLFSSQAEIMTDRGEVHLKADLNSDSSSTEYFQRLPPAKLHVHFKQCPFGFYSTNTGEGNMFQCQCNLNLSSIKNCSIEGPTITKRAYTWIGMYKAKNKSYLAYSNKCPLDYCKPEFSNIQAYEDRLKQNDQCQHNRTGILCGSCPEGWSLILGSFECRKKCSNMYLLLILPFALAGLLLVVFIHYLNLTVTMGTVCGLIFYANIIQDYSIQLLTLNSITGLTPILQIFLSWLNLDFGIPTCLYHGMRTFGKTIIPSLFPVYIWVISAAIIYLSRRYISVTKLVGSNAVKVLATLFLLSYSKMLRVTISSLGVIHIQVVMKDGTRIAKARWILDGSIPYYDPSRHLGLMVVAFLFIGLSLPFSIMLLCIRRVYSLSNCSRFFSRIDKLKPFFDTYTGPFKDNTRFWTGFLLCVRVLLLALHAWDFHTTTRHLIIIATCFLLSAIMFFFRGVYKSHSLNCLEYFYILNIAFVFIFNVKGSRKAWTGIVNHMLVGSAFVSFLAILAYHIFLKCHRCKLAKKAIAKVTQRFRRFNASGSASKRGYEPIGDEVGDYRDLMEASSNLTRPSVEWKYGRESGSSNT